MADNTKLLAESYDEVYDDWLDYLLTDFNILIRGRGSKVSLVQTFCNRVLNKEVVHVYGHLPGETIKSVMQKIVSEFKLELKLAASALIEDARRIAKSLEARKVDGCLVIHNLDSPNLRDPLVLEILSVLVKDGNLRLIATLSCLWGDIYWNQEVKRSIRFVEYTIDTSVLEMDEFYYLNPKLAGGKGGKKSGENHTLESLDMIWTALPLNSQKIFLKMYELVQCLGEDYIQYHELLEELKKEFWTLNEHLLGQQLTEFVSHSVIKKTEDGAIMFTVEPVLLANFVETVTTSRE